MCDIIFGLNFPPLLSVTYKDKKEAKLTSVLVLGWLWLVLALETWEARFISFWSWVIFSVSSFSVFMMLALSSGFMPRFFSSRLISAWKGTKNGIRKNVDSTLEKKRKDYR